MNIKKFGLVIIFIIFHLQLRAQFNDVVLENLPYSTKWRQINSPNFKVLFIDGSDSLALQTINTLETLYKPSLTSLQTQPEKITVILQQKNTVSNGFVTLGPRRSEFYVMPPQDYKFTGTNNWMDMLAVHEYRHVVQFSKSNRGFNKAVYYLFGEDAYGLLAHLALPGWFWEGDAVGIETALTNSGRGRIPFFYAPFRTNLLEKGPFDYDKQMLRSFKDYVPNEYVSGYFMTTHLRRKYGKEIWDQVTDRAFHAPFLPWRLPIALKNETDKSLKDHYHEMINDVSNMWKKQLIDLEVTEVEKINQRENATYTNYNYPQIDNKGNLVVLKSGLSDIQQFVFIDNSGNERKIAVPGLVNDAGMLSVSGNKLAFVEHEYNPRWLANTYSVIKILDLETGKIVRLTKKSRYSAASISPDQTKIATILNTEDNQTLLVVLDAKTGEEIKRFANPKNEFLQMPRWSDDGTSIALLKIHDQKKAIALINFETGNEEIVAPYSYENYGHPVKYKSYLFYNSAFNGIDNIYVIDLEADKHYQVTSRKYGSYNPVISSNSEKIYFNDYTVNGMDVVSIPFNSENWKPKDNVVDRELKYYQPLVEQEAGEDILLNIDNKDYQVTKYNWLNGLINPYAWGFYSNTTADDFLLGVVSQDILSTTTISGGYQFDAYGERNKWFGKVSYQGFFPIIDVGFEHYNRNESVIARGREINYSFNETIGTVGLKVPLLLTKSKFHEHLTLGSNISFGKFSNFSESSIGREADYRMLRYNAEYFKILKQSKRDIRSKWGIHLFGQYSHLPIGGDLTGQQFFTQGALYLPGFFKHHSIRLSGNYQYNPESTYPFGIYSTRPRGDNRPINHEQFALGSIDYAMPLIYPDFNISSLVNIQRIKTNFFYDFGIGEHQNNRTYYYSLGVDLSADLNIFRLSQLFEIGVRYAYVPETGRYSVSPLIGMFAF